MNVKQWRQQGARVVFRYRHVYLIFLALKKAYETRVNKGHWMQYVDLEQKPWIDVSSEMFRPSYLTTRPLSALLIGTAKACYCDAGVDLCDYCAGRRGLASEQLNEGTSRDNPITFFKDGNTDMFIFKKLSEQSQLRYEEAHGTVLDRSLPHSYEYECWEIDFKTRHMGWVGSAESLDRMAKHHPLNVQSVYDIAV